VLVQDGGGQVEDVDLLAVLALCSAAAEPARPLLRLQGVEAAGPFDAVVALDVIEHTETPREDLERAARILRPGGALLLKTFYDEWHEGRELAIVSAEGWQLPHGYFDPVCHINHFTEPVLRRLIEQSGFDVAEWDRDEVNGLVTVYARRRP